MSLTIGDTPPNGVAVLFFEALITGVSLQPSKSSMSQTPVSALTTPVEVEFGHLQTDTAFLSLANVNPDTYDSMTLTFGSATLTIVNHSGGPIGTCMKDSVCELTPSFSPTMATISMAPFPITINKDSVVGIRLDFDVNSSVQETGMDLSINPVVTVKQLTQRSQDEDGQEMENMDEVDGQVTAEPTGSTFTLMNERSGQSFTITVDKNTMFEDFDRTGCTANPADITCIHKGQVLDVDLSENGMGMMLAKRVEFEEDANKQAIKGTITSVDNTMPMQTQFHMVVFNEEPAMGGISEGSVVTVNVDSNAMFQVGREEMGEDGGFSLPGLSFASGADLVVGQDVQIRPETVTSSGGVTTVTTNLVRLWPSQITGTVDTINNDGTFTLMELSPLFTGATPTPITTIKVVTLSGMDLMDSQAGSLTKGSMISVKGLLFNTTGMPTLVTRTAREHQGD
jgi:hypothetical protein